MEFVLTLVLVLLSTVFAFIIGKLYCLVKADEAYIKSIENRISETEQKLRELSWQMHLNVYNYLKDDDDLK